MYTYICRIQSDPDTVLFVMGDHGMTDSGDHGMRMCIYIQACVSMCGCTYMHSSIYMHVLYECVYIPVCICLYAGVISVYVD